MQITIQYHAQARAAAGVASEVMDLDSSCGVQDLLARLAERHGEKLRMIILTPDARPHPSILMFVGEEQVRGDWPRPLRDGDVVSMLSPIAGG